MNSEAAYTLGRLREWIERGMVEVEAVVPEARLAEPSPGEARVQRRDSGERTLVIRYKLALGG